MAQMDPNKAVQNRLVAWGLGRKPHRNVSTRLES